MADVSVKDSCPCGAEFAYTGYYTYTVERHNQWLLEHDACRKANAERLTQVDGRCGSLAPEVTGAAYRPSCALNAGHRGWHSDRQKPPCEWSDDAQANAEAPGSAKASEVPREDPLS